MLGLKKIPQISELAAAYTRLSAGTPLSEERLSQFAQWTRFDPRLGEIWVQHLSAHWKLISPVKLNHFAKQSEWPAVLGVLLSMIRPTERALYDGWVACATAGLRPAQGEQFFIGIHAFAGREMRRASLLSSRPYRDWGFLGTDLLINKQPSARKTYLTRTQRMGVLEGLRATHRRIRVKDYLEATHGLVSLRQAQLDLRASGLKIEGKTRNRVYVTRKRKKAELT